MLAFARRSDLKSERIDVASLVHGMSDLFQRSVGPEISLETRFPLRLPAIIADPNQVENALLNLVVNARDAIEGMGQITVGAREQHVTESNEIAAGKYVCLYVTDNGVGMDEETLRRATKPFYTTKSIGKGTGLGLSMAQGLAEQSNGKMVILSKQGSGTTIEMWFPVAPPEAQKVDAPPASPILLRASRPRTILAVDDDMLVLLGTVAMLEDLGHTVHSASSGADALEVLRTTSAIELIVTDQAMPKMTGIALAKRVREVKPDMPIIIATGYAELPAGEDDFQLLSKPFMQDDLEAALNGALRRKPAPPA
jgi:CheY-like chemotaxis protein